MRNAQHGLSARQQFRQAGRRVLNAPADLALHGGLAAHVHVQQGAGQRVAVAVDRQGAFALARAGDGQQVLPGLWVAVQHLAGAGEKGLPPVLRALLDTGTGQHMAAHRAEGEGQHAAIQADQRGLAAGAAEVHGQYQFTHDLRPICIRLFPSFASRAKT